MCRPDWLPDIFEISAFNDEVLERLHQRFLRDFVRSCPLLNGLRVKPANMGLLKGMPRTFWHIVSTGPDDNDREIDFDRCRRVPWIRPIIEHCTEESVLCWETVQKRSTRVKLWLCNYGYAVILGRGLKHYGLITAFVVRYDHEREGLRREYERWAKSQKPPA